MKTVYIVGGNSEYNRLFTQLGYILAQEFSEDMIDLVCFTGGEDVSPSLYGDKKHPYTGNNLRRDIDEQEIFGLCEYRNIPMVGICRGAQFTNVMSGGRMYQHVEKHTMSHTITDVLTSESIYVSSTHHQMMMPSENALLVASSTLGGTREWYDGEVFAKDVSELDNEVVFYEHTKCLCFQPHPEFSSVEYEGMKGYFESLLSRFFGE